MRLRGRRGVGAGAARAGTEAGAEDEAEGAGADVAAGSEPDAAAEAGSEPGAAAEGGSEPGAAAEGGSGLLDAPEPAAPVDDVARAVALDRTVGILLPVALGLGVVSLGAFAPAALSALVGFLAAGAAGFLRPEAPGRTGGLVFAPTALLSVLAVGSVPIGVPALAMGLATALVFSLVAAHLGAGLALRRQERLGA